MPISVECSSCGKRLKVKDELLGKKLKCPGCGTTFFAEEAAAPSGPASAASAAVGMMAPPRRGASTGAEKQPRVAINKSVIIYASVAVLLPTLVFVWKIGPGAVAKEWAAKEGSAKLEVRDVVDRIIQAHLSNSGGYNPRKSSQTPQSLDVTFVTSPMSFSMPEKIGFAGTSTQGAFVGRYFPKTGEVEAEVEIDGVTLPSGVIVSRGETIIKGTGRSKDGKVSAEIDGKKAEVYLPPNKGKFEE